MSAHYNGNKLEPTGRYELGKLVGSAELTRNFLLMTATPHNGKEEDFQAWLALIDPERFHGKARSKAEPIEINDIMRRMVKEDLLTFDARRMQFIEIDKGGQARNGGAAPYLNYETPSSEHKALVAKLLTEPWLKEDLSAIATSWASEHLVKDHFDEVKRQRRAVVKKPLEAVCERQKRAEEARPYNELITSWPAIVAGSHRAGHVGTQLELL